MELIAVAEDCIDIAEALRRFLIPVDDESAEITALIAECYSVSSALRHLERTIGPFPYHRYYPDISYDLTTVKDSLHLTFEDVHRILGRLGRVAAVPRAEYEHVWDDLRDFFYRESGNALRRRLEIYGELLEGLTDILEGAPLSRNFYEMLEKTERLLDAQQDQLVADFARMGVGGRVVPRLASFERRRPRRILPPREDPFPDPRGPGRDGRRGPPPPAPLPDDPGSPTSSNTFSTRSSNLNSILSNHWLPKVFEQSRPSTPLEDTGQTSECFYLDMPGCMIRLEEMDYINLHEEPFENGDLLVRLYQRSDDYRSRFLCRTRRPRNFQKDVVLPLIALTVTRSGPFLKFIDIGEERRPRLWASLKFTNYELMVVFFCAFLALRSEDNKLPLERIEDHDIHRETELFAGRIVDDHYEHGLRLFQDEKTGVIRLQASVQSGEVKRQVTISKLPDPHFVIAPVLISVKYRKPIWTAFITHQITSSIWMSRFSRRVVHLAELNRHVFTDGYVPQRTQTGEHELTFIQTSDAEEFVDIIKAVAKDEKARRKRGRSRSRSRGRSR